MSDPTFMADPTRLVIAAIVGIALLLALIIKFKLHPVLSMMVSALAIGIGAGMPLDLVADTVTKGVGTTLQNIALLIGLGSMFGQILEESGGAKKIAQTFIDTFGQGHSSWALGITGLVIGTTVFFEAGVVVLIPLAFSVASQTKKSTLYYGPARGTGGWLCVRAAFGRFGPGCRHARCRPGHYDPRRYPHRLHRHGGSRRRVGPQRGRPHLYGRSRAFHFRRGGK